MPCGARFEEKEGPGPFEGYKCLAGCTSAHESSCGVYGYAERDFAAAEGERGLAERKPTTPAGLVGSSRTSNVLPSLPLMSKSMLNT